MSTANKSTNEKVIPAQADIGAVELIDSISAEQLADVFRSAGYRVTAAEQNGIVQLMSASQGVGFVVRFGNGPQQRATQKDGDAPLYLDYTLSCAMQVQGELPADLVASWNRTKRFARLAAHAQFLVLEMDVVVAGGVSPRYLLSIIELWDRLIQEFLLHLRNRPAMAAAEQATQAPAAGERNPAATTAKAEDERERPTSITAVGDGKATLQ